MLKFKIKKNNILKKLHSSKLLMLRCVSVFIFLLASPVLAQADMLQNTLMQTTMASLATMLFYILNIVIQAMGGLASMMDFIFTLGITDANGESIAVVKSTWALVRNFSNMFFIVGLVMMAFATIFDISKYDFRTMIIRFLIVALLINFSLVIGETIIDWTQSISGIFLGAMGSYGNLLGGPLDPSQLLGEPSGIAASLRPFLYQLGGAPGAAGIWLSFAIDTNIYAQITQMFFSIILGSIIAFSLLVGVIFTAIRIPILWGLLILAPAAWVCSIFPPLAGANRSWWKHFLGWNFFLPIYLFFLYVGMLFLQQQDILMPAGATTAVTGLGFSFQTLFFYGFVGVFMIYGAKFAMSGGMTAGAGGVAGAIWAKGRATARYAGSAPWRMSGAADVYKETRQKFKEQGFAGFEATEKNLGKLYQGQQGRDKAAAWLGEKTGLAPGMAEKQMARNIDLEKTKLRERRVGETELRTLVQTSKDPAQKIAAAQRLQEEYGGSLDANEISKVLSGVDLNSEVGAKIFKQLKLGDVSSSELRKLVTLTDPNNINNSNARSLIYNALIDRGGANKDEFQAALTLANGGAQKASIIRKGKDFITNSLTSDQRKELLSTLTDAEAKKEIVKIMAGTNDAFFNDPTTNAPSTAILQTYSDLFENVADKKKFLEDVSKKDAYHATMVMLDAGLFKDDTGTIITRATHTDAKEQSIRQTLRKLSVDDKLTQHKAQYSMPNFQDRMAEDMSRNTASFEKYLNSDKYVAAQSNIALAQETARRAVYTREYLQPFNSEATKLRDFLRNLRTSPPAPGAIPQIKLQAQAMVSELKNFRKDYEKFCRRNDLLKDPTSTSAIAIQGEINSADRIIDRFNKQIASL